MTNQFDLTMTDFELLAELELCADLMAAANTSEGALTRATIDCILEGREIDTDAHVVSGGVLPARQETRPPD